MKLRVAFTRPAKLDLDELIAHIGEENPRAAVNVATRILDRIRLLQEQPDLGHKGRRSGTRELVVDGTRGLRGPLPAATRCSASAPTPGGRCL